MGSDQGLDATTTVAELVAFLDRTHKALGESERSDLVDKGCMVVWPDGVVQLSFGVKRLRSDDDTVLKAISLDPTFALAAPTKDSTAETERAP